MTFAEFIQNADPIALIWLVIIALVVFACLVYYFWSRHYEKRAHKCYIHLSNVQVSDIRRLCGKMSTPRYIEVLESYTAGILKARARRTC